MSNYFLAREIIMQQDRLVLIREKLENMENPIIFALAERIIYRYDSDFMYKFKDFWKEYNKLKLKFFVKQETFEDVEEKLFSFYFSKILFENCANKDLAESSILAKDLNLLSLVTERLLLGISVAQAKFQSEPELYQKLAKENNKEEIMRKLTNSEVEEKILFRIEEKAKQLNFVNPDFNPEAAVSFYRDCIIPLTKEIELAYLLNCK